MPLSILIIILLSMMIKDLLYSVTIALVATGHGFTASIFDLLGDIASVVCISCSALSIFVIGLPLLPQLLSIRSVEAFSALGIGSIIGTVIGTKIGARINKHFSDTIALSKQVRLN